MKIIQMLPLKKPVVAEVTIPGSKSYTNRALLMAAMTNRTVRIVDPLQSDDTHAMIECLRALGIRIDMHDDFIEVVGGVEDIKDAVYELDAHLSGTTIRFLLPFLAVVPGTKVLKGKEELNKRPIKVLVDALRGLGAHIEYLDAEGYPPLRITSSMLKTGTVTLDGGISSQYFSALLMVAPLIGGLTVNVGGTQISKPYIDMTIDTMKKFGVNVVNKNYEKYVVQKNESYGVIQYSVEGDFSSAGYFFAIAALTKSTLTVKGLNPNSVQADKKILDVLEEMGNTITYEENKITIEGKGVKAVEVDMIDFPDQAQTLAVLAAFADGTTKLIGVQSLRVKETERVIALENELKKMGIQTSSTEDTLTIHGGSPKPARINTYGDHRMAMSFAVAGAKLADMEIVDPAVVSKTFPDFWEKINSIGITTKQVRTSDAANIVLIGMRGSGKTTIAKLLAQKLQRDYLELDELIVAKNGMSIPEIVEKHGWNYFRDQESSVVEEVSSRGDTIISTGGGVVMRPQNIEALKKNGVLVFLSASVAVLSDRIGDDPNRPALTKNKSQKAELGEVLQQRKKLYEDAADIIVSTDTLCQEDVADRIISKMKEESI